MGQVNMDHTYENIDKVKRVLLVGEHTVASAILACSYRKIITWWYRLIPIPGL